MYQLEFALFVPLLSVLNYMEMKQDMYFLPRPHVNDSSKLKLQYTTNNL